MCLSFGSSCHQVWCQLSTSFLCGDSQGSMWVQAQKHIYKTKIILLGVFKLSPRTIKISVEESCGRKEIGMPGSAPLPRPEWPIGGKEIGGTTICDL